jgi:hypothetical protein
MWLRLVSRTGILLVTVIAFSARLHGQHSNPAGGPFSSVAVPNAPLSADAITNIRETLPDRSVREQTVTAHYYRDSQGRVRAELDTPWGPYVVVQLFSRDDEPAHGPTERMRTWVLDPSKRTYRAATLHIATHLFNGEGSAALPVGKVCFQIAPQVVAHASDDERLRTVNAQVSPDLGIVIASHRSDHIGSVEYELTNIRREEPPAKLFEVPTDYTFVTGSHDDPLVTFAPWQSKRSCEPRTR